MNLVLIPLPGGQWAAFEPEELAEAIERARSVLPLEAGLGSTGIAAPAAPELGERWLSSKEMADLTGVPDTWWEAAARSGRVPARYLGKYLRFKPSEAHAALPSRRVDPTDTDSLAATPETTLPKQRLPHGATTGQPRSARPDARRRGT